MFYYYNAEGWEWNLHKPLPRTVGIEPAATAWQRGTHATACTVASFSRRRHICCALWLHCSLQGPLGSPASIKVWTTTFLSQEKRMDRNYPEVPGNAWEHTQTHTILPNLAIQYYVTLRLLVLTVITSGDERWNFFSTMKIVSRCPWNNNYHLFMYN